MRHRRHRAKKNPVFEQRMDSLNKQIYEANRVSEQLRRARLGDVDLDPDYPVVRRSDLA